ncbi:hypothetical protein EIB71_07220 [Kaistella daneshvariae]|uniref:Uncharacterized protein n=2 Tax=Kaistella TaxID=2782231 RepID=A0A1I3N2X7_9FLAO|nr:MULTISPECIES: ABC-three component system middle component 6 [Kaistella]AZI67471.1 hypothetical protein EIB71_07220 [Kaistella daneshvariae]SFJ03551.1 hypothetical protein SAMN05421638_1952 [Kaistella treverensis]
MIVNKNINPERDLYYLGGKVIEILDNSNNAKFDYFELYSTLIKNHDISINLFTLVLDWLFILGAVKKDKKGLLEKCF